MSFLTRVWDRLFSSSFYESIYNATELRVMSDLPDMEADKDKDEICDVIYNKYLDECKKEELKNSYRRDFRWMMQEKAEKLRHYGYGDNEYIETILRRVEEDKGTRFFPEYFMTTCLRTGIEEKKCSNITVALKELFKKPWHFSDPYDVEGKSKNWYSSTRKGFMGVV